MSKLIYSLTTSIDGYIADKDGNFEWASPSEEVLAFIDSILRNVGTFLLGRNMYETLAVWDTFHDTSSEGMNRFAEIWRAARTIVYSSQLTNVRTANTTLKQVFDPKSVRKMVSESNKDFNIGGPHLAAEAIKANIIDEYHQNIVPCIVGGGIKWLPPNVQSKLELMDVRKFKSGVVHLQYNKT